jgi:hypothetical protein
MLLRLEYVLFPFLEETDTSSLFTIALLLATNASTSCFYWTFGIFLLSIVSKQIPENSTLVKVFIVVGNGL